VSPRSTPLRVLATLEFEKRYRSSPGAIQSACDRAIQALAQGEPTPDLRVKPILPAKRFLEARLNRGDRLIFRIEAGDLLLVDLVTHDEIKRWGRL